MYTEIQGKDIPLRLDQIPDEKGFETEMRLLEEKTASVVYLEGSLEDWERIKRGLLMLRSSNVPVLLVLKRGNYVPTSVELEYILMFLRDWDQLCVHNILDLCGAILPEHSRQALQSEARFELKWFREWLVAEQSQKISAYPGLPWRSFIRRTVAENYKFASSLVALGSPESPSRDQNALDLTISEFLKSKKKAINIFPKKFGQRKETSKPEGNA